MVGDFPSYQKLVGHVSISHSETISQPLRGDANWRICDKSYIKVTYFKTVFVVFKSS